MKFSDSIEDIIYKNLNENYNYYIFPRQSGKTLLTERYLKEYIKRSQLPDSEFGIPEDRKYPLDTEKHVQSAIRLFGHAEESKKKLLAHRIANAAKKYGIEIPETTQCYKYLHESYGLKSNIISEFLNQCKNKPNIIGYERQYFDFKPMLGISISESKDFSKYNPSFKKKTGGSFKYIQFPGSEAEKYLINDNKWNKESVDDFKTRKVGEVVIDTKNDKVAGWIFVNKSGVIGPLRVYDDYRGYGLSNKLLEDAINKYHGMELGVYKDNEVALKLYEKHGFKTYKIKKYKDGDEVYLMKLKSKINESYIEEGLFSLNELTLDNIDEEIEKCNGDTKKLYKLYNKASSDYYRADKKYKKNKTKEYYEDRRIKWKLIQKTRNAYEKSKEKKLKNYYKIIDPIANEFIKELKPICKKYSSSKVSYSTIYCKDISKDYTIVINICNMDSNDNLDKYTEFDDIFKEFKNSNIIKKYNAKVSFGDGDEGCIYIKLNKKNILSESSSYNYFITNELHDEEYNAARYIQMILFQELDAYMVGNHIRPVNIEYYDCGYKIAEYDHDNEFLDEHVWNFIKHVSNMVGNSILNKYEIRSLDSNTIGVRLTPGKENVEVDINAICANFGWMNNDSSFEDIDESVLNEFATGAKVPNKYKIFYGDIISNKTSIKPKRNRYNRMEIQASLSVREAAVDCINTESTNISTKTYKDHIDIFIDKKNFDLANDCSIYELVNDGNWFYKNGEDFSVYRRDTDAVVKKEYEFNSVSELMSFVGGVNLYDMNTKIPLNHLLESNDLIVKSDIPDNGAIIEDEPDKYLHNIKFQLQKEFNITPEMIEKARKVQEDNPYYKILLCDTYTMKELDAEFDIYAHLTSKQRKNSNGLSVAVYGYNVLDMYNIIRSVINKMRKTKEDELDHDVQNNTELVSTNINPTLQEYVNYIKEEITSYGRDKSYIAEMLLDLYNEEDLTFTESIYVKRFVEESIKELDNYKYDTNAKLCPYFTPEKMLELGVYNENAEDNFYKAKSDKYKTWFEDYSISKEVDINWYNNLLLEWDNFTKDPTPINYQTILELGWNPELYPSMDTIQKASEITKEELVRENKIININLTKTKWTDIILSESNLNNDLLPIYIITSFTETPFGKLIRKISNSRYTHACLSFDTSLEQMYSFNMSNNTFGGGLSFESISEYLNYNPNSIIKVQVIFVKSDDMRKIKTKLDEYIANYKNSSYEVSHCIDILLNRARTGKDFSMICSEFVASILRVADIDIVDGKSANIISPKDLSNTFNNKVYLVYEGLIDRYDPKEAEKLVNKLQRNAKYIKESNTNDYIIKTLESYLIQDISPILETKAEFNKEGDLIISDFKKIDFEKEYYHSNKLLKVYNKNNNYDGMKKELAKLWYLNSFLEDKLYRGHNLAIKNNLDEYNKMRSKILNLFNTYLKIVTSVEPDFDFMSYYETTSYYDNKIKISKYTMKGVLDNIKRFLK